MIHIQKLLTPSPILT